MASVYETELVPGTVYELGASYASVLATFVEFSIDKAPRFTPVGSPYPFRRNPSGFIEFEPRPEHVWFEAPKTQEDEQTI